VRNAANRILVGLITEDGLLDRLDGFAYEERLSRAKAVTLLVKEALDRRVGGEETRQGKGPAG